jgi:hypothetical protein
MNSFSTSLLNGGLGNVLFQISNAYAYSLKYSKEFVLFPDCFGHTTHVSNQYYFNNILKNIKIQNTLLNSTEYVYVNESDHSYNALSRIDSNVCFKGYYQSYKYFIDYIKNINNLLNVEFRQTSNNKCAIHIRRGDYLNYPNVYEILDVDYYYEAMNFIGRECDFYIFTNDISWCLNKFKKDNIHIIDEPDPVKSLYQLASFNKIIIANSTFSWWAAFLNNNDKIVVSPNKWFKPEYLKKITKKNYNEWIDDMIPKNWFNI